MKDHLLGFSIRHSLFHLHYWPASSLRICLTTDELCTNVAVFFLGWRVSWDVGFITWTRTSCWPSFSAVAHEVHESHSYPVVSSPGLVAFGSLGQCLREARLNPEDQAATPQEIMQYGHSDQAARQPGCLTQDAHPSGSALRDCAVPESHCLEHQALNCQFENQTLLLNTKTENLLVS